jgi:hypothetical protein
MLVAVAYEPMPFTVSVCAAEELPATVFVPWKTAFML